MQQQVSVRRYGVCPLRAQFPAIPCPCWRCRSDGRNRAEDDGAAAGLVSRRHGLAGAAGLGSGDLVAPRAGDFCGPAARRLDMKSIALTITVFSTMLWAGLATLELSGILP